MRRGAEVINNYRHLLPYDMMATNVDRMWTGYVANQIVSEIQFEALNAPLCDIIRVLESAETSQDARSELVKVNNAHIVITDALAVFDRLDMEKPVLLKEIRKDLSDAKVVLEIGLKEGRLPDSLSR